MILDQIVKHKKKEIEFLKNKKRHAGFLKSSSGKRKKHAFYRALSSARGVAVIAEIKRRSPSKGILRKNFDPVALAREFESAGASALSVLTDKKFFGGSLDILKKVRAVTKLPILRKDFILDEAQVREAAEAGADAILLIAAILTRGQLSRLSKFASTLGLDVLFEVHDQKDIQKILPLGPKLVGINNRNLKTFKVDLSTTERLAGFFTKKTLLVSESGIFTRKDIERVNRAGARAVLVGESLMKQKNVGEALSRLLTPPTPSLNKEGVPC